MPKQLNYSLIFAACLSAVSSLLHIGIVIRGASWYRFFGAGERMAKAAEDGRWYPAFVTAAIAIVLALWSAYALAGAGVFRALPLQRPVLLTIALIYLLRGLALFPALLIPRTAATPFWLWSSSICLVFAAAHLVGLTQVRSKL